MEHVKKQGNFLDTESSFKDSITFHQNQNEKQDDEDGQNIEGSLPKPIRFALHPIKSLLISRPEKKIHFLLIRKFQKLINFLLEDLSFS
jgi:hypothetical protein